MSDQKSNDCSEADRMGVPHQCQQTSAWVVSPSLLIEKIEEGDRS